jgi:trimeric autotransporter adhesin
MRELSVLLTLCFALFLAATFGAGCGGQTSGSGCGAQCATATPTVPSPTNAAVNHDADLKGDYAFTFSGFSGNGSISSVFATVGRFTADGAGNLTSGELDTNGVGAGTARVAQSFTGTYSIGADNRGVMTLNTSAGSVKFAFAMLADGKAQWIEFDASGGTGTIGSGTMEKADTTAYSTARMTGDYAFGAAGFDNGNNRAAIEGRFTSNGTGTLTNAAGDVNAYGSVNSMNFTAANYTLSDTATGRGTMNLAFTFGGTPATLNFVLYVVNSGKLFVMESDAVATTTPLLNGVVVQQQTPAAGFSNASLNSNMVIYLTGLSMCGSGSPVPKAVAGLLTADGNGALTLTFDENFCRAPNSVTGAAGTYSASTNGRTSITIGGNSLVAYLVNLNQAFLFVSDPNVLFGFGEPQAAGSFTNSAVQGTYTGSAATPASFAVVAFSGEFTADGVSPTGSITGREDIGAPSGPVSGAAFNATYSVSPSPTNGRGTMTVTSGTGGNAVIYVISPSKFVGLSSNDPNPAILIFEQSSSTGTPTGTSAATLSSLTLSPTTVVGGAQSSTGTVTLSGPAPTGGAQVALASDNAAASVPSSVTVPAGATNATFPVNTAAVAASTTVTISASFGGVTQTAPLTVTPPPPPLPTVSSLTLNPASVVGGLQSSTGTVTLSGPAPAGGAQVALASDNAAASVPSSVTVPAGASSATFTVSTSAVLVSTSVTISASYNGTTQTATLTVTL